MKQQKCGTCKYRKRKTDVVLYPAAKNPNDVILRKDFSCFKHKEKEVTDDSPACAEYEERV